MPVSRLIAALILLFTLTVHPAFAQTPPAPTPEQRALIEGVVRDYLLNNPEILRDAFQALERREQDNQARAQAEIIARSADLLTRTGRHAVIGNPTGDVTLVEFFDYNCSFCRRAHQDMQELIRSDPKLRVVLKEFPVLGPGSIEASMISAALIGHPRFPEFHSRLLSQTSPVNRERALAVAREVGLDTRALETPEAREAARAAITEAHGLANALNLGGTPTYIIGEDVVVGAVGIDALRERITAMRRCGRAACG